MSKKKQKNTRRRFLRLFILFLVVLCAVVILISLPVWRIKNVSVEGGNIVAASTVTEKLGPVTGQNIFVFDYWYAARRINAIPQVKKAWVWPRLPSTLLVKIEERIPFAVAMINGEYLVLDDDGYILEQIKENNTDSRIKTSDLPVVVGLKKDTVVGDKVSPEVMASITKSFRLLGSIFDKGRFVLEIVSQDNINIIVDDVLKVKIGFPEKIEDKLQILSAILHSPKTDRSRIEYVDLRVPEDPAVKFR